MKLVKCALLMIMLMASKLYAQWNYVVDVVRAGDSTALVQRVKVKEGFVMGDTISWLHNGDTVFIAKADSGFAKVDKGFVTVTIDKQKYFVNKKDLMFGDNSPERTDFVNSSSRAHNCHTHWGHLYLGTTNPYWLTFALLLAATLLALIGRRWLLAFVPFFLLAATVIEIYGLMNFGTDMLWWIEGAKFRSWHDISRLLLFALAVTLQVGSLYIFRKRISEDNYGDLVVWRPVFSALFGTIAAVALIMVCTFLHVRQNYVYIIGVVAFCIVAGKGFIGSMIDNCEVLSIFGGIMFTLFVLIWGVGALAAIILLVMSVLKSVSTLIALPIAVVLLFALLMLGGIAGSSSSFSSSSSISSDKDNRLGRDVKRMQKESAERAERERRNAEERRRRELQAENDRINRQRTEERFERYKKEGGMW